MSLFKHPSKVQSLQTSIRTSIMTPPSVTFGFANFGKGAEIETVDEAQKFLDVLKTNKVDFVNITLSSRLRKEVSFFLCLFQLASSLLRPACSSDFSSFRSTLQEDTQTEAVKRTWENSSEPLRKSRVLQSFLAALNRLLGSSSPAQLEANLLDIKKGPLPSELVDAREQGWQTLKDSAISMESNFT